MFSCRICAIKSVQTEFVADLCNLFCNSLGLPLRTLGFPFCRLHCKRMKILQSVALALPLNCFFFFYSIHSFGIVFERGKWNGTHDEYELHTKGTKNITNWFLHKIIRWSLRNSRQNSKHFSHWPVFDLEIEFWPSK